MREITTSCTLIAVCIKIYQSDLLISSGMVIIVYSSLLLINYLLNSYNNRINLCLMILLSSSGVLYSPFLPTTKTLDELILRLSYPCKPLLTTLNNA